MIIIKRLIWPLAKGITPTSNLLAPLQYSFAMMNLFEQPKKPHELDPAFKKKERLKGHLRSKNRKGYVSPKLNPKVKETPMRLKNHKGMLKRVKIVKIVVYIGGASLE